MVQLLPRQITRLAVLLALLIGMTHVIHASPETLKEPTQLLNATGYMLKLLDIDKLVAPGQSFRPTILAEISQPIAYLAKDTLKLKELATNSQGMPLQLQLPDSARPLHAYLVVYPVYVQGLQPTSLSLHLDLQDISQARQGKIVQLTGTYTRDGTAWLAWVMWLGRESLDVDCGCS